MHAVIGICNNLQVRTWNLRSNGFGLLRRANPITVTHNNQSLRRDRMKLISVIKIFFLFGVEIIFG
jgi:hypothetical protein